eukprot:scaffold132489_cov30-Tisochrysis_lutea.AAC.5
MDEGATFALTAGVCNIVKTLSRRGQFAVSTSMIAEPNGCHRALSPYLVGVSDAGLGARPTALGPHN